MTSTRILYVVRHNLNADSARNFDRIGLVIVPAYTRSEMLHTTCRDLSELAQTTVFVGNAEGRLRTESDLHTRELPPPMIFQSGKDERELSKLKRLKMTKADGVYNYQFKPALPLV